MLWRSGHSAEYRAHIASKEWRNEIRPHPMSLFAVTCELREDCDVYGWCDPSATICEYCEDYGPAGICLQCRRDLQIPADVR